MKAAAAIALSVVSIAFGYFVIPEIVRVFEPDRPPPEIEPFRPFLRLTESEREPGLEGFHDLEYVKFTLERAFHPAIEITAYPNVSYPGYDRRFDTPFLEIRKTVYDAEASHFKVVSEERVEITLSEFSELEALVARQDMFDASYTGTESMLTTDGSWWILEGKKADLVIQHKRRNPLDYPELKIVTIGLRFLELADIELSDDEIY